MRKAAVIGWLLVLLTVVVTLFWHNEWIYSLPTPVPQGYKPVTNGSPIDLGRTCSFKAGQPVFLHFFNPDCPCSRFNIPHFKSLVKQYGDEVNFAIVPVTTKKITPEYIRSKFDLDIPVLSDTTLAARCGVYSTPQAVIIDASHHLYYRGNYNRSRYCSDQRTEYARIALQAILNNQRIAHIDKMALKAYGCQLPKCTKP